jgi:membrane-bound inhibitor of C-type lysozyme
MSELQTMLAVGQVAQSDSSNYGNRTVTYTAGDRKITVTYAHDKATQVQEASGHA